MSDRDSAFSRAFARPARVVVVVAAAAARERASPLALGALLVQIFICVFFRLARRRLLCVPTSPDRGTDHAQIEPEASAGRACPAKPARRRRLSQRPARTVHSSCASRRIPQAASPPALERGCRVGHLGAARPAGGQAAEQQGNQQASSSFAMAAAAATAAVGASRAEHGSTRPSAMWARTRRRRCGTCTARCCSPR